MKITAVSVGEEGAKRGVRFYCLDSEGTGFTMFLEETAAWKLLEGFAHVMERLDSSARE